MAKSNDLSEFERTLIGQHKILLRKQENTVSDQDIRIYQIKRKNIRNKLVEECNWSRKEANELANNNIQE